MFPLSIPAQFATIIIIIIIANDAYVTMREKQPDRPWDFLLTIIQIAFILFFGGVLFETLIKTVIAL